MGAVASKGSIKENGPVIHAGRIVSEEEKKTRERIEKMKRSLDIDETMIEDAWKRLQDRLDIELKDIEKSGDEIIPEVDYNKIMENDGKLPSDIVQQVNKRGILIVRSVLSKEVANQYHRSLVDYMEQNGEDPHDNGKTFYEVYWSKAQVDARQHPNIIATQKALLELWKRDCDIIPENISLDDPNKKGSIQLDSSVNLAKPMTYIDRMRFRKPGSFFNLYPHMDSGSITRWSDPVYRNAYQRILSGNWEEHDPFLVGGRGVCKMDEHCSFFRAFQGWTSLSEAGPGDGTLRVLPLLKEAIAYVMMRPFIKDVAVDELPGYHERKIFYLSPKYHALLRDKLVSIPKVFPGDTVWWHPDLIHSVEASHDGKTTNSVLYIPTGPDCPVNQLYAARMRIRFLSGLGPPDFNGMPENEKSFTDRAGYDNLSADGRTMMGFS